MKARKPILALALALALTLTACGSAGTASSAAASASSAKSNTLVYGSNDYTRINPALDEHGEINALLFDGLTGHDKDNQVVPRLAESWELDKDTNTYTFHLRQDVTWHDGEKFTAEDVKFTIEAIQDPKNESENASNYEDVEKITVVDDHTVKFQLAEPNYAFLDYMTMGHPAQAPAGGQGFADRRLLPPSHRHRPLQAGILGSRTGHHPGAERGLFPRPRPTSRPSSSASSPDSNANACS